ncbi:unnamed protein product [Ambrosiozyma monospora]|uniref:Unnamed protein product n=1 Tax=Ambrosiozyma monospora TaxID=43982 RepID=A0A9W6YT16_AMBMO|nr:unnamed protein product [Ambrosiozyma monospora]
MPSSTQSKNVSIQITDRNPLDGICVVPMNRSSTSTSTSTSTTISTSSSLSKFKTKSKSKVTKPKRPIIQSKSFVGVTSRSKNGCNSCRAKKKKCDEHYPVCGLCEKKNLKCIWRNPEAVKNKTGFNFNNMLKSQIALEKHQNSEIKNVNGNCLESTSRKGHKLIFVNTTNYDQEGRQRPSALVDEPVLEIKKEDEPASPPNTLPLFKPSRHSPFSPVSHLTHPVNELPQTTPQGTSLSPFSLSPNNWNFKAPTISYTSSTGSSPEVEKELDSLLQNIVHRMHSPDFHPETNTIDSLFSDAFSLYNKSNFSISNVKHTNSNDGSEFEIVTPGYLLTHSNESVPSSPQNDEDDYLPLDESQLIENSYLTESQLLETLRSTDNFKYFKPAVKMLFKSNKSLHIMNPHSPLLEKLDDTGRLYLEHYMSYTSEVITVCGPYIRNVLKQYFLRLANFEESILYGIVAWGGMFLMGGENKEANEYFDKGLACIHERRMSPATITNHDFIVLSAAFIALIGAKISSGDTKSWYQLFIQSKDLLAEAGGLLKFIQKNKDSNECKWIASNFFYHDVTAVRSLNFGTLVDIEDYKTIFQENKLLENDDYGMDPFQGISHPIFIILGEVVNKCKQLKTLLFRIELIKANLNNTENKSVAMDELQNLKKQYDEMVQTSYEDLEAKILHVRPTASSMKELDNQPTMLENHLTNFELCQISLRIGIRTIIKQLEFNNHEVQSLKAQADQLFDMVLVTPLRSTLCLPLLLLGITSYSLSQRQAMTTRYERLIDTYEVKNLQRSWEVIQLVWIRIDENVAHGKPCHADWCEICDDLGWNFCYS